MQRLSERRVLGDTPPPNRAARPAEFAGFSQIIYDETTPLAGTDSVTTTAGTLTAESLRNMWNEVSMPPLNPWEFYDGSLAPQLRTNPQVAPDPGGRPNNNYDTHYIVDDDRTVQRTRRLMEGRAARGLTGDPAVRGFEWTGTIQAQNQADPLAARLYYYRSSRGGLMVIVDGQSRVTNRPIFNPDGTVSVIRREPIGTNRRPMAEYVYDSEAAMEDGSIPLEIHSRADIRQEILRITTEVEAEDAARTTPTAPPGLRDRVMQNVRDMGARMGVDPGRPLTYNGAPYFYPDTRHYRTTLGGYIPIEEGARIDGDETRNPDDTRSSIRPAVDRIGYQEHVCFRDRDCEERYMSIDAFQSRVFEGDRQLFPFPNNRPLPPDEWALTSQDGGYVATTPEYDARMNEHARTGYASNPNPDVSRVTRDYLVPPTIDRILGTAPADFGTIRPGTLVTRRDDGTIAPATSTSRAPQGISVSHTTNGRDTAPLRGDQVRITSEMPGQITSVTYDGAILPTNGNP